MRRRCGRVAIIGVSVLGLLSGAIPGAAPSPAAADETRQSPYMPKIVGQEDFLYVWTMGVEGLGDGFDKLVTIGANPEQPHYGEVIAAASVGGRYGAHQAGFSDDRRQLWAGGLADDQIFLFDMATDPANPDLVHRIEDFVGLSGGVVGPNTFYALPGRMMITGLSNARNGDGRTGIVEFSNLGEFLRTTWMPDGASHGFDARVSVRMNRMLTSSFTGQKNYARDLDELLEDAVARKDFGSTMVVWDHQAGKPLQILDVPGAPLEIRWALRPRHDYAFTTTALTSKLWGVFRNNQGSFDAVPLVDIGDPREVPLPVDISLSSNDRTLFVDTFRDGTVHVYDVSNPREPKLMLEQKIASRLGRVSQSWDGRRVYFTSSLFASWAESREEGEDFVKAFGWDGDDLELLFALDFEKLGLGRPQIVRFGSSGFYRGRVARLPQPASDLPAAARLAMETP